MHTSSSSLRALLACAVVCSFSSFAAQTLRVSVDQHGDFVMIGNTLGQECASGTPAPIIGTVSACGSNTADSAPDLFWRSDTPASGDAIALLSHSDADARSTAMLTLPTGARVTHAFLYWAAYSATANADTTVTLDRVGAGGFSTVVSAGSAYLASSRYLSWADVTSVVQANGAGPYRLSGVTADPLANVNSSNLFAGWSLIVFYELATDPLRNLTVFDGLDGVASNMPQTVTLSGFLVPASGFSGTLGVMAFDGDNQSTGDQLFFNGGAALSNAQNPADNFFNSTRSHLGVPTSVAGDLPRLTGGPQSMSGVDLDVVDVTSKLTGGQTSATVQVTTVGDVVFLAGFVTSISTFRPDFSDFTKTVVDLNGGSVLPGDVLEYTLTLTNSGNDTAIDTVLRDALPTGVTYAPGSIQIVSGANAGPKTDASGDDQAEFNAGTNTITVRVGTAANASLGGSLPAAGSTAIKFRVTISAGFVGSLSNQANVTAAGQLGAPTATTNSDGAMGQGQQPTVIVVDACATDAECGGTTPRCSTAPTPNVCVTCLENSHCSGATPSCDPMTNTCVACASDMSCTTPTTPACQMSGACAECSATNATVCAGNKPVCVTSMGFCGCNADGDCGDATSGRLCEGAVCQGGCALGRNDCAADQWCDVRDGGIGACIEQCASDSDCTAQLTHCDVGAVPAFCVECTNDAQCAAGSVCSPTTKTCVECTATNTSSCSATMNGAACLVSNTCGCVSDVDCGDVNSGRICDATTSKCTVGCSATGNGCPAMQTCSSGTCVTIVVDAGVGVDAGVESDAGVEVDAGVMSDAGMPTGGGSGAGGGGGSMMTEEPMGGGGEAPSAPTGCGCTSVDPSLLIAALGLLLTRRSSR